MPYYDDEKGGQTSFAELKSSYASNGQIVNAQHITQRSGSGEIVRKLSGSDITDPTFTPRPYRSKRKSKNQISLNRQNAI